MLKNFNWKPYIYVISAFSLICLIFNWKISFGILIGTICYFVNAFLGEKKFFNLNSKTVAIGSGLLFMFIQGLLILICAITAWIVGKLICFFAVFFALVIPTIYFLIVGGLKK